MAEHQVQKNTGLYGGTPSPENHRASMAEHQVQKTKQGSYRGAPSPGHCQGLYREHQVQDTKQGLYGGAPSPSPLDPTLPGCTLAVTS